MRYPLENARFQWEAGWERALGPGAEAGVERRAGRAAAAVREELRRRLGSGFTAAELADLYGAGIDWALDLARPALDDPAEAHDAVDAAFWEHLRLARDFAGGVRAAPEELAPAEGGGAGEDGDVLNGHPGSN